MAKKNEKFEVIYQVNDLSSKNYLQIFRYNGKKFRIRIIHENGTPLGFNSKCCVAIMLPDGTFSNLVDFNDLQVKWENQYFIEHPDILNNKRVEKAFKEYVEKVYAD